MKYNPYTRYTIVGNVLDLINSKIPAVTWPTPPNNNKAEKVKVSNSLKTLHS